MNGPFRTIVMLITGIRSKSYFRTLAFMIVGKLGCATLANDKVACVNEACHWVEKSLLVTNQRT